MAINFGSPSDNGFVNSSVENGEYTQPLTPYGSPIGAPYKSQFVQFYTDAISDYLIVKKGGGTFEGIYSADTFQRVGLSRYDSSNTGYTFHKLINSNPEICVITTGNSIETWDNTNSVKRVLVNALDSNDSQGIGPKCGAGILANDRNQGGLFKIITPRQRCQVIMEYDIDFNGNVEGATVTPVAYDQSEESSHGNLVCCAAVPYNENGVLLAYTDGFIRFGKQSKNMYSTYFMGDTLYTARTREQSQYDGIYCLSTNGIFAKFNANTLVEGDNSPEWVCSLGRAYNDDGYSFFPIMFTNYNIVVKNNVGALGNYISNEIFCISYEGKLLWKQTITDEDNNLKYGQAGTMYTGVSVNKECTRLNVSDGSADDSQYSYYTINTTTNQTT